MKEVLIAVSFFSVCLVLVFLNLSRGPKKPKVINDSVSGEGYQFNAVSINSFLEKSGPSVTVGFNTTISPKIKIFENDMKVSAGGMYKISEIERVKYQKKLLVWRVLIFFKTGNKPICVIFKKKELALEMLKKLKSLNNKIETQIPD